MKTKIKSLVVSNWSLVIILLFAAVLRLWNLGNIPPSLTPDEAALGYNAYSILKTGRDEHGDVLPIIFSSFGDYKPGLYVYATVPFVALFGLNEWSVRVPSALAGILSVFLIYKIVLSLAVTQKNKVPTTNYQLLANLSALSTSVSPWLIHLSRGAWETNLSLTLTLAGIYFFLLAQRSIFYILYSSVFFALTFLTYQGAKLSTSIVIVILAITYWKQVKVWLASERPLLVKSISVGLVIVSPIILSFFQGRTGRLEVNSVFSYPRPNEYTQTFLQKAGENIGDPNYYLYHSETLNFTRGILGRWFNHFSGRFLFFEGDYQNPRHSAPNHGVLLLFDIILLPLGLIYLIRSNKFDQRFKKFIILWLLIAPLPSALSRDQVHAVRSLNMAAPLIVISALGLYAVIEKLMSLRANLLRVAGLSLFLISYFLSLTYFLDSYFIHLPIHNAKYWYYGYKQAVQKVLAVQNDYEKIIFLQSYSQPYIYFLFYGQYDPRTFQNKSRFVGNGADVSLLGSLDKIEFQSFSWPPGVGKERTLVVGDSVAIPDDFSKVDFNLIEEIKYPDNLTTAFRIIEKKNTN